MPETATLVTALIMERPLCLSCISTKSGSGPARIELALAQIGHVLTLQREEAGRCRLCGETKLVFSLLPVP